MKTATNTVLHWFLALLQNKVFLALLLLGLFIRFPFFFRDYVDRDESTFILLAQSWVDGFLPYTHLWDLKPPLTFAFFAGIITVFGKSFIAIRFFGTLLVVITAYFTYLIGLKVSSKKVALGAGVTCIMLLSLFGSLQGVMSEHLCMAFFVPAVYLILAKPTKSMLLWVGILMGITVMIKLNMAYPVLFVGLYLCYDAIVTKNKKAIIGILLFGTGIIAVILATIIPYYLTENTMIWWKSVVLAPLEYSENRRSSLLKLAPFFIFISAFLTVCWKKQYINFKDKNIIFLVTVIAGILVSFLKGGRINGHYLIQLHPILVVLVAVAIGSMLKQYQPKLPQSLLWIVLLIPAESYLEYVNVVRNKIKYDTFFNGEGFSVPNYIIANHLETKNILFLGYHIGYWNVGELPPTKAATHPSNICRDEIYPFYDNPRKTSVAELRYLMEDLKPKTVVIRKGRSIFDKKEVEENNYMNAYLAKYYALHAVVEGAEIFQRL